MGSLTAILSDGLVSQITIGGTNGEGDIDATYDGLVLVVPTASDAQLAAAYFEIKAFEKAREIKWQFKGKASTGFTCSNGLCFDADLADIQRLKAGYDLATSISQTTLTIRDYGNTVHADMPLADVWLMIQELGVNYQALLANKWTKEQAVKDAVTLDDLSIISW